MAGLEKIKIRGARQHNLQNVDVDIPKNSLVVVTGPSGSGKSSLAFDTLYAEGQRRYVESLSAYARQFLGMQDKPDVDEISGLSPAISIEQKGASHNPRSTVGTVTEVYDYLRLLFGRVGVPHCPKCSRPVVRHSVDEIVDLVMQRYRELPVEVLAPMVRGKKGTHRNLLESLRRQGYLRAQVDGHVMWLEDDIPLDKTKKHTIEALIDRFRANDEQRSRLAEAVESALRLGEGFVLFRSPQQPDTELTEKYVCPHCQISMPELEPRLFSFNSPYGACPECSGIGSHEHFEAELAVDPSLSPLEGGFLPWKPKTYMIEKMQKLAELKGWDLGVSFDQLPSHIQSALLEGAPDRFTILFDNKDEDSEYQGRYEGLLPWLKRRWSWTQSEQVKDDLDRYREEILCAACGGRRLKPEVLAVRFGGYSIADLTEMPIDSLLPSLSAIRLPDDQMQIVRLAMEEIVKRISFLRDVGAGYLSLSRRADSLSGGESQRIRLATQIGSQLTGVLYVLDEPTIGLHPRDTDRLLATLKNIRDIGNTVLVVEHDRDTMAAADHIVEIGPGAGINGGHVVACGPPDELASSTSSTAAYLRGEADGCVRIAGGGRRMPEGSLKLLQCGENNLKGVDVTLPLGIMGAISGVSGSGKSTLLYEILYKGLRSRLERAYRERSGRHLDITGYDELRNVVLIDQSPIGRMPRSNPATYTGLFTPIREFFAQLPESKLRGYQPGRFSFNVKGGRCEACGGDGMLKVSMLFLPDVYVKCDVCKGRRYNRETLEVKHRGNTIADVLEMSVEEAAAQFKDLPRISGKLQVLMEAGLGYIKLGQPAPTLSGGEAQRVKLATELSKKFRGHTLYLLDEPTTGLHYTDVKKLLVLLHKLVNQGNTVWMIEHNLDVLASADWIVDMGPEGGAGGGRVVCSGTPEEVADSKTGHTSKFLAEILK